MPENTFHEATIFCHYIVNSLDRLLACLDGLSAEQLNWQPAVPNANSLYALTTHTLGNTEENILFTLFGKPSSREREKEFLAQGYSADELIARWHILRTQMQEALLGLSSKDLQEERTHPRRGVITGLDILIVVARHTAEHLGQAELTRDLMLAATSK